MKVALAAAFVVACGVPEGLREPTGVTQQFVIRAEPWAGSFKSGENKLALVEALTRVLPSYGFDPVGTSDRAFATGDVIDLFELEMPDPAMPHEEGVAIHSFTGANPQPPPCADPDPTCGRHLDGNGHFDVVEDRGTLIGKLGESIEMSGGPFVVHANLFDTQMDLRLLGAHVFLDDIVDDVVKGHIIGGLDAAGFEQLAAAWQPQVMAIVERDCKVPTLPDCGCVNMGEDDGHSWLKWFDSSPRDCKVSVDEILESVYVNSWFAPIDGVVDGVLVRNFGINFEAVRATFDR